MVADACKDETAEIARQAGARVLETDFKDKAGAQNAALSSIHTDVVIGFDGDTMPQADCISLMMEDIDRGFDATCATILPLQEKGFWIRARRFSYSLGRRWWRLCQRQIGRLQVLTGAAYAFRTDAIKAVGGFPDGLISADMDATWALHKAGYKVTYTSKALALTVDPETYQEYRSQMRRWSSGYFQTMAKYKFQLLHPRAALVVGCALVDLLSLFWAYAFMGVGLFSHSHLLFQVYAVWFAAHMVVITTLVATVVGPKEAVLGLGPYLIVNFYNKWLYLCAFGREWILGRHYSSWTGRHGRKTVITPMTLRRKWVLAGMACFLVGLLIGHLLI